MNEVRRQEASCQSTHYTAVAVCHGSLVGGWVSE